MAAKLQTSNSKLQGNFKLQAPRELRFASGPFIWNSLLQRATDAGVWSLKIGAWCFSEVCPPSAVFTLRGVLPRQRCYGGRADAECRPLRRTGRLEFGAFRRLPVRT